MLEKLTVARPYADAVFELAREHDTVALWSEFLALLALIVADPDMQGVIRDPRIGHERLASMVLELIGLEPPLGGNFVRMLGASDRLLFAPEIAELFERRSSSSAGITAVEVVSAYELQEGEVKKIKTAMGKRLGRQVSVSSRVDSDLIAGVVIHAGDLVIDASVRGRLRQLIGGLN